MRTLRPLAVIGVVLATLAAFLVVTAGSAGALTADPTTIEFGPVPVGATVVQLVHLTPDPGYSMRTITNFNPTFVGSPSGAPDDCVLDTSAPCTQEVIFEPTSTGDFSGRTIFGECLIGTLDGCIDITINATGTGVQVGTGTATAVPANPAPGGPVTITPVNPCPPRSAEAFYELEAPDGTVIRTSNIPVDGAGNWTVALTAPTTRGLYTFRASCLNYGNIVENYAPVSIVVGATTTTVAATPNPVDYGQSTTVTATVAFGSTDATPTGSVTFTDGGTVLGTVALSGGVATLSTAAFSLGTHHITATYSGNGLASTGSTDLVVQQAPTALQAPPVRRTVLGTTFSAVLTSDGTPVAGQTVSFTARTLFGTSVLQCTATTDAHGVATCRANNQPRVAFASTYQATFAGTPQYHASTATARFSY